MDYNQLYRKTISKRTSPVMDNFITDYDCEMLH